MTKSVESRLPGIVVVLIGAVFAIGGISYHLTKDGRMAPGLVPFIMGLLLVILGALLTAGGSRWNDATEVLPEVTQPGLDGSTADRETATADLPGEAIAPEIEHPKHPWLIFATMVASLLLAPYIGLLLGLAVGAFVMQKFIEGESWLVSTIVTLLLVVASWYVFDEFLGVVLPYGVFDGVMN